MLVAVKVWHWFIGVSQLVLPPNVISESSKLLDGVHFKSSFKRTVLAGPLEEKLYLHAEKLYLHAYVGCCDLKRFGTNWVLSRVLCWRMVTEKAYHIVYFRCNMGKFKAARCCIYFRSSSFRWIVSGALF